MIIKYIILAVIVLVVLWKGKPYLRGLILKLKDRKNIKEVKKEFVYTPVISSRTFNFAIEITEVGDGKATISVVKCQ